VHSINFEFLVAKLQHSWICSSAQGNAANGRPLFKTKTILDSLYTLLPNLLYSRQTKISSLLPSLVIGKTVLQKTYTTFAPLAALIASTTGLSVKILVSQTNWVRLCATFSKFFYIRYYFILFNPSTMKPIIIITAILQLPIMFITMFYVTTIFDLILSGKSSFFLREQLTFSHSSRTASWKCSYCFFFIVSSQYNTDCQQTQLKFHF
jgi:hypothetical protein